jgi:hypothetical protein
VIPNSSRLPSGRCVISPKCAAQKDEHQHAEQHAPKASRSPGCRGTIDSKTGISRKRPMTVAAVSRPNEPAQSARAPRDRNVGDENRPAIWGLNGVRVKYCLSATNITTPRSGKENLGASRESATIRTANCAHAADPAGSAR